MDQKEPVIKEFYPKQGIELTVDSKKGVVRGRVVFLPHLMPDEEKALAAQKAAAQEDPDRLPDDDSDEEYPR